MPPYRPRLARHARDFFIVQAGLVQFKQCYQCFKYGRGFGIIILQGAPVIYGIAKAKWPAHNRDTIWCSVSRSGSGEFFRVLNVTSTLAG